MAGKRAGPRERSDTPPTDRIADLAGCSRRVVTRSVRLNAPEKASAFCGAAATPRPSRTFLTAPRRFYTVHRLLKAMEWTQALQTFSDARNAVSTAFWPTPNFLSTTSHRPSRSLFPLRLSSAPCCGLATGPLPCSRPEGYLAAFCTCGILRRCSGACRRSVPTATSPSHLAASIRAPSSTAVVWPVAA